MLYEFGQKLQIEIQDVHKLFILFWNILFNLLLTKNYNILHRWKEKLMNIYTHRKMFIVLAIDCKIDV